jgi:pimeloyl-ACP methyl ester carboxylesterase
MCTTMLSSHQLELGRRDQIAAAPHEPNAPPHAPLQTPLPSPPFPVVLIHGVFGSGKSYANICLLTHSVCSTIAQPL